MKSIAIFLSMVGMFLVVRGYYQQVQSCPPAKVVVKYVPRSLYEEQLSGKDALQLHFRSMFEDAWRPAV
jgi:sulfur relay (sulfurtransferase) DsrC/TusE family protein